MHSSYPTSSERRQIAQVDSSALQDGLNESTREAAGTNSGLPADAKKVNGLLHRAIENISAQGKVNTIFAENLLALEKLFQSLAPAHQRDFKPRPMAVYMGDNLVLCRVLDRYKMFADARDTLIASRLFTDGYWEPWITNLYRQFVKPGMTVVDIGANIGYYTVLAGDLVGPQGCVHAVEPSPRNFEILKKNIFINHMKGWVQAHGLAAFNVRKKIQLNICDEHPAGSSLFANPGKVGLAHVEVDAVPLDEVLVGPVDFMKIRAEGAEPWILEGLRETIDRSPNLRILTEFSPGVLEQAGTSPAAFIENIRSMGFRMELVSAESIIEPASENTLLAEQNSTLLLTKASVSPVFSPRGPR